MQAALSLSRRNLGQAWPNPAVGALLVRDGQIISQGWTGRGGRPHAETAAIEAAGDAAKGATLYVTLEPCSHHGKTPPCTDAIIKAGIAKVVVACRDPHLKHGGGIEKLKGAGIEIVENICEQEARELNCGFFSVVEKNRPYVALKIATSADEKITFPPSALPPLAGGVDIKSPPQAGGIKGGNWITGEPARDCGHLLRSQYDAILTGIGTVLADDPLLTCRLPGLEDRSPVRIILDRKHRLPKDSQIARTQDKITTWVLDSPDIPSVLAHLAEKGITRLLVEGGQQVTTAFLDSGSVDKVYWFKAPKLVGNAGLPALCDGKGLPEALVSFTHEGTKTLGPDTLETLCSRDS